MTASLPPRAQVTPTHALYTVPKLPVPSFSRSVYWADGSELFVGAGARGEVGEDGCEPDSEGVDARDPLARRGN